MWSNKTSPEHLMEQLKKELPEEFSRGITFLSDNNNTGFVTPKYFIKVQGSNSHPGYFVNEVASAAMLQEAGIKDVTRPATRKIFDIPGHKFVTVWELTPGSSLHPSLATQQHVQQYVNILKKIHALPAPFERPLYETVTKFLGNRRGSEHWRNADQSLIHDMEKLLKAAIEPLKDIPTRANVLTHGDAHFRNSLIDSNTNNLVLCDFEGMRAAPPEWDIACLKQDIVRVGQNPQAWVETPEYDDEIIKMCEAAKIAVACTYMIANNLHKEARERLNIMQSFIDNNKLPETL